MARTRLVIALALAVGCTALTGAAFAGPPDDPGKSENAPGQEKKAEAPAPAPAATPPASPGKSTSAPGNTKTSKAATPSKPTTAGKPSSPGKSGSAPGKTKTEGGPSVKSEHGNRGGRSAEAHHHIIICHRTGSDSNPYVVINIPMTAWNEAHKPGGHPTLNGRDDFILKDPASRPGSKDGFTKADCVAQAGIAAPPPTVTTTPTVTTAVTPAVTTAVTPLAEGEVAGVQARIPAPKAAPKAKPRGGVLGALGAVAGEELPFTGLPLWIAALIGLGLVSAGFGARKAMR